MCTYRVCSRITGNSEGEVFRGIEEVRFGGEGKVRCRTERAGVVKKGGKYFVSSFGLFVKSTINFVQDVRKMDIAANVVFS